LSASRLRASPSAERLPFSASTTRSAAIAHLIDSFRRSGIEDPIREARLALCAACGLSPAALLVSTSAPLGETADKLAEFAARRVAGEPLSRIVGRREFWGLPLTISLKVLDPRPETETIVEAAAMIFRERRQDPLRILDLGVGSGALLCALLSEFTNGQGLGVDVCHGAAEAARNNITACGLISRAEIRVGDWTSEIDGPFDLIVSNPPYIPTPDIAGLPRVVRDFDPLLALDGGPDGLAAYRAILPACAPLLAADGWLLVEIGADQATEVMAISTKAGFIDSKPYTDLAGRDRVIAARRPESLSARRSLMGADRR
jgi:release factor glutamine methyltransferase